MWRLVTVSALVACVAAAVFAGASRASDPCADYGSSPCTDVTGPWVVVPVPAPGFGDLTYYLLPCPAGEVAAAGDATPPEGDGVHYVVATVELPVWNGGGAQFVWSSSGSTTYTVQPLLGCIPAGHNDKRATSSAVAHRPIRRTKSVTLHRSSTRRVTHACAPGEKLIRADHSLAFWKKTRPTAAEIRELSVKRTVRNGRVLVTVKTGPHNGDDERVELQVHVLCER